MGPESGYRYGLDLWTPIQIRLTESATLRCHKAVQNYALAGKSLHISHLPAKNTIPTNRYESGQTDRLDSVIIKINLETSILENFQLSYFSQNVGSVLNIKPKSSVRFRFNRWNATPLLLKIKRTPAATRGNRCKIESGTNLDDVMATRSGRKPVVDVSLMESTTPKRKLRSSDAQRHQIPVSEPMNRKSSRRRLNSSPESPNVSSILLIQNRHLFLWLYASFFCCL